MTVDRPQLVSRSADGKLAQYTYRAYDFAIEHYGFVTWWCHQGIAIPRDPLDDEGMGLALEREDGWGSLSRRALLRKLKRAVDSHIARTMRERQIKDGRAFVREERQT